LSHIEDVLRKKHTSSEFGARTISV